MDIANFRRSFEKPGESSRRGMEVCHPVFEIFRSAERDHGELVATRDKCGGVFQLLGEIDPLEVGKAVLLRDGSRLGFGAVGGVTHLGEKQGVLGAELCGGVVEVWHIVSLQADLRLRTQSF